ncbi:MAG: flagellar protein FlgN [Spirochaetes bacterium]|nr:flagellar protein FlgN [Spirochaetota bacterium]
MSKKVLEKLARIMDEEINDFKQLLEYEKLKNKVIINQEVDKLKQLSSEEEDILEEINKLEEERESIVNRLYKEYDLKSEKVLSSLIKVLPSEDDSVKNVLTVKKNELIRNIKDLKKINLINNKLLMDSVKFFSYAVNSIQEMDTLTYKKDGSMPKEKDNSWLINKQA